MALTAGVGSDHVDLHAAAEAGITVAEVTGVAVHLHCSIDTTPTLHDCTFMIALNLCACRL